MANTPDLKHWSIDMIKNTQQHVHTERLEKRVEDLEKRIDELERAFYEKVDISSIGWPEIRPPPQIHE